MEERKKVVIYFLLASLVSYVLKWLSFFLSELWKRAFGNLISSDESEMRYILFKPDESKFSYFFLYLSLPNSFPGFTIKYTSFSSDNMVHTKKILLPRKKYTQVRKKWEYRVVIIHSDWQRPLTNSPINTISLSCGSRLYKKNSFVHFLQLFSFSFSSSFLLKYKILSTKLGGYSTQNNNSMDTFFFSQVYYIHMTYLSVLFFLVYLKLYFFFFFFFFKIIP